jgi:hypothetical protein
MVSFSNYDLQNVKANDFEVIPPGDYPAIITECEEKPTKNNDGKRLNLKIQILDGKFQNRILFDGLNTENKSAIAQQIGRAQLKAICIAINNLNPKDSSEILNKPLMVTVKIGKDQDGNPRNEIKGYKARLTAAKPKAPNLVEEAFNSAETVAAAPTEKKNPFA